MDETDFVQANWVPRGKLEDWEDYFESLDAKSSPTAYVFRCLHCGALGGYCDCDRSAEESRGASVECRGRGIGCERL